MIKTLWILLTSIGVGVAQLTLNDIDTPESAYKKEHSINVDSIGYRETVTKLSNYTYLVTGKLYNKQSKSFEQFVAIQVDNGENDQTCIRKHRITAIQLERMKVAYISILDLNHVLNGGYKASMYPLCGNAVSGYSVYGKGYIKLNTKDVNKQFIEWHLDYSNYTDTIYIKK